MNQYCVYVLKSLKDGKRYIGITSDFNRRIEEHNKGSNATPSTKGRGPFELKHQEFFPDMSSARQREKFFKSGAGRDWLKKNIPE